MVSEPKLLKFPCDSLPDDPAKLRLLGIYPQRSMEVDGLFMQRIKVPAGRLTCQQWRGLAELATNFTKNFPLHVTTRQDIELHGVYKVDLPALQHGIASLGLSGASACGDAVRNITVCPRNGCCSGTWDVDDVVRVVREVIETLPWRTSLPRKFKISISGCRKACARPWLNDVGIVANEDGSFQVILAGSLGAKPGSGMLAYESLPASDIVALVVAVLRLFNAEGERTNRGRARLRHLRERLGDDVFLQKVEEFLQMEKRSNDWPVPVLHRVEVDIPLQGRLFLPLGDITPEMVFELVDTVEAVEAEIRIGISHDLLILGQTKPVLSAQLSSLADNNAIVVCPGSIWCMRGFVDCRAVAEQVRNALLSVNNLELGITGCPNNCSQAVTMDIGLVGRLLRRNGQEHVQGFRIFAGGGKGQNAMLAQELHPGLPAETIPEVVSWLVDEYQRSINGGQLSFAGFISNSAQRLREELSRRYNHWNSGF